MPEETTKFRLYLMRSLYLLNFVFLGLDVWPKIINHVGTWDPMRGVAFSFWAALSALAGLGIRYPLRMVPLLLLQLSYKSIWLLIVALPLWSTGRPTEMISGMTTVFGLGVVLELIVIPWPYVFVNFVKNRGDRWK